MPIRQFAETSRSWTNTVDGQQVKIHWNNGWRTEATVRIKGKKVLYKGDLYNERGANVAGYRYSDTFETKPKIRANMGMSPLIKP